MGISSDRCRRSSQMLEVLSLLAVCVVGLPPTQAQQPSCTTALYEDRPDIRRLTCSGETFNFTRAYFSLRTQKLFVGATNLILSLNENLTISQTEPFRNDALSSGCLAECTACVLISNTRGDVSFCRLDIPPGEVFQSCLSATRQFCENVINIVQPVTDGRGNEFLVTCGTMSMYRNVSNCVIRRLSDLSITASFSATITSNAYARRGLLTMGADGIPAVDQYGNLTGPYYVAGHIPGEALTFNNAFTNLGFIHNFEYDQLDFFQRMNSDTFTPPLNDFNVGLSSNAFADDFNPVVVNRFADRDQTTRYQVQYTYKGHVYIFAAGSGVDEEGGYSHGTYIWRYCQKDNQNATYLATLRRVQVVCSGRSELRDYRNKYQLALPTSNWRMHEMTAGVEMDEPAARQPTLTSGPYVIAAFQTLSPLPQAASICAYDKEAIKEVFDTKSGRNFTATDPCSGQYSHNYPACGTDIPLDNIVTFTNIDYVVTPNQLYPDNTLRGSIVPSRLALFHMAGVRIVDMDIALLVNTFIIIAGTSDGRVLHIGGVISRNSPSGSGAIFKLSEITNVGQFDGAGAPPTVNAISIMDSPNLFSKMVIVASQRSITKIPAVNCAQHSANCSTCVGNFGMTDVSCVWCNNECSERGASSNCNPLEQHPVSPTFKKVDCVHVRTFSVYPGYIVESPTDNVGSKGGTIRMSCTASGTQPTVSWYKLDAFGIRSALDMSRITIANKTVIGNRVQSSLELTDLRASDGGRYVCVVETGSGPTRVEMQSNTSTISVRPYITLNPDNAIVFRSQSATMLCGAEGNPVPKYQWLLNGEEITPTSSLYSQVRMVGSEIIFLASTIQSNGTFRCRPHSDFGSALSQTAALTVIDSDPGSSQVVQTLQGGNVVISCPAAGASTYTWYFDGTVQAQWSTQNVTVTNAQLGASGRYICQNRHQIFLYVQSSPRIAIPPTSEAADLGGLVQFSCLVNGSLYPPGVVTWSFRRNATSPAQPVVHAGPVMLASSNQILSITALAKEHAGIYACLANNSVGDDSATATLTVNTPLSISGCPSSVYLPDPVAPLDFTCNGTGPDGTVIGFYRDSQALQTVENRYTVERSNDISTGQYSARLSLPAPTNDQAGFYQCRVTHANIVRFCNILVSPAVSSEALTGSGTSGSLPVAVLSAVCGGLVLAVFSIYFKMRTQGSSTTSTLPGPTAVGGWENDFPETHTMQDPTTTTTTTTTSSGHQPQACHNSNFTRYGNGTVVKNANPVDGDMIYGNEDDCTVTSCAAGAKAEETARGDNNDKPTSTTKDEGDEKTAGRTGFRNSVVTLQTLSSDVVSAAPSNTNLVYTNGPTLGEDVLLSSLTIIPGSYNGNSNAVYGECECIKGADEYSTASPQPGENPDPSAKVCVEFKDTILDDDDDYAAPLPPPTPSPTASNRKANSASVLLGPITSMDEGYNSSHL